MKDITSKHFKNIICLTTTEENQDKVQGHISSDILQKRTKQGDLALFVYGGSDKDILQECRSRRIQDSALFYELHLACAEEYKALAQKTYRMIKYCFENFSYDRLYKGDDTKKITERVCDFDHKYEADFVGSSEKRVRKDGPDGSYWDRHHISMEMHNCRTATFKRWAKRKNISVNPEYYDGTVWYSGWKPYGMSKKFTEAIATHGRNYSQIYCDHLGGCEDHMIGKIFQDLQIPYKLKIQ